MDDKILEVVAVFGTVQMAASRVINLQHHRIAQCRSVRITITGKAAAATTAAAGVATAAAYAATRVSTARTNKSTLCLACVYQALYQSVRHLVPLYQSGRSNKFDREKRQEPHAVSVAHRA